MNANSEDYRPADGEIPEPPLGVFVLTEFVYCPRAGLCAFETGHEEKDDSPPRAFFSFDPLHSLLEIEAAITQTINELRVLSLAAALSAGAAWLLAAYVDPIVGLAGIVALLWFLAFAFARGLRLFRLNRQRREALAAQQREPDPKSENEQTIHWWDFLRAGFEPEEVHAGVIDHALNLSGKPTRYLRRGNTVIPVWRMRNYNGKTYPQHLVRMAAYCQLVRESLGVGVECPYGVILFGDSFDGVAIPFTPKRRDELLQALEQARNIIHRARFGPGPGPEAPHVCAKCPYGYPKRHKANVTDHVCNGKTLILVPLIAPDDKVFHSLCGDRFRWLAPHEDVQKLELRLLQK